jgi:hypothetical protein
MCTKRLPGLVFANSRCLAQCPPLFRISALNGRRRRRMVVGPLRYPRGARAIELQGYIPKLEEWVGDDLVGGWSLVLRYEQ